MIGLIFQGLGHGWSQPSITAAISRSVDESDLGIAAASNRLFGQGGAAFGITLLTLAYGGRDTPEAFASAFIVGTALSAISVLTALWIGRAGSISTQTTARAVPPLRDVDQRPRSTLVARSSAATWRFASNPR